MKKILSDNSGLTIIEVLISAVIFVIGFSLIVVMLNHTLVKFSTRDLSNGAALANEIMQRTVSLKDTTDLDSTVVRSGVSYTITRKVELQNDLVNVTITVLRTREDKELIKLHNEFILIRQ